MSHYPLCHAIVKKRDSVGVSVQGEDTLVLRIGKAVLLYKNWNYMISPDNYTVLISLSRTFPNTIDLFFQGVNDQSRECCSQKP